jgi:hypothetical protein
MVTHVAAQPAKIDWRFFVISRVPRDGILSSSRKDHSQIGRFFSSLIAGAFAGRSRNGDSSGNGTRVLPAMIAEVTLLSHGLLFSRIG